MAAGKYRGVAIRGVVGAVPGLPLDISDVPSPFSAEDLKKLSASAGVRTLHRVQPGQTAGDLSIAAADALLTDLVWERSSIDGVVMVTQNPDHFCPATACIAQEKLCLPNNVLAFDVGMGCSGYIYGLFLAANFISSGACRRFLLLAGDTPSVMSSWEDRGVAALFGDAGTATAVEFDESAEEWSFLLGTDGSGADNLIVPAGAFREPASVKACEKIVDPEGNVRTRMQVHMDGLAIFNFALQRVPPLIDGVLKLHAWNREEVDLYLLHQANDFIVKAIAKRLKLPLDRVPGNIAKFGNTSVSTIGLLIADEVAARLKSEAATKTVLAGFGVGYSWGAMAGTLRSLQVAKIIQIGAPASG